MPSTVPGVHLPNPLNEAPSVPQPRSELATDLLSIRIMRPERGGLPQVVSHGRHRSIGAVAGGRVVIAQDRVHAGAGRVSGKEATVLVIIGVAGERAEGARQVKRGLWWPEVMRK